MSSYWPWWAGAIGLALITINYTLTTDRSFGVSGAWQRVVHWRREREVERLDAGLDEQALLNALSAGPPGAAATSAGRATVGSGGTMTAFVHEPIAAPDACDRSDPPHEDARPPTHEGSEPATARPRRPPVVTQVALLVSIVLGGTLAAATSGRLQLRLDMGEAYRTLVTGNPLIMVGVLFVGGVLVGFGTRLAGGCSSGHGLSGCGRLYPVSLLATTVFFGTAVLVSFLLAA